MLDEREWAEIHPLLIGAFEELKEYRSRHPGLSLVESQQRAHGPTVLQRYFELTGLRETNINAIWHHRASAFGPPCHSCGKPFRTPKARFCAECPA
jgi:hypothetical protein